MKIASIDSGVGIESCPLLLLLDDLASTMASSFESKSFAFGSRAKIAKKHAIGLDAFGTALTIGSISTGRLVALATTATSFVFLCGEQQQSTS